MSTFVLVHGAWQSNGTWDLLTPLLTKHGHSVITPVLTGLGTDQSRLSAGITLTYKRCNPDADVFVMRGRQQEWER